MARRPHPIDPTTWRYKLAQIILSALYGRKWHYISPWKQSGVGVNAYLYHKGKILTAVRTGNIEYAGWREANFGGHLNLETRETLEQGMIRELQEELGLTIDISKINFHKPLSIVHMPFNEYIEQKDGACISMLYGYHLSEDEVAQIHALDEVSDLKWMTKEELLNCKKLAFGEGNVDLWDRVFAYFEGA